MSKTNIKIDISSKFVEQGVDVAKNFLGKLIVPSVEEAGLLIKENVTFWRFKNQVRTLTKAHEYCLKNGITPKSISLKLLCPLLENASLEEDDFLQDKWAILLSNLVDSSQNIENHVFPFLLGQISQQEFIAIEQLMFLKEQRKIKINSELEEFRKNRPQLEAALKEELSDILIQLGDKKVTLSDDINLRQQRWKVESELRDLNTKEQKIKSEFHHPDYLPHYTLAEFELANLIRLGLIKIIPQHYVYSKTKKIKNEPESEYIYVEDLELEIENQGDEYDMTELGVLFISACQEKNRSN